MRDMSVRSSRSSHSRRHGLFRRKAPSSFMAEADSPLRRPGPPRRMALSSLMAVSECIDTQQQVTKVTCSSRGSPSRGFGVPLQLTDRESGITVCLVSTMRYNPTSILRVVGTVDELAKQKRLGAVVIESCPTRYMQWKKTTAVWRRALMTSEMQIAAERAKVAGVEYVLGRRPPRCVFVCARASARVSVHSLVWM